MKPVTGTAPYLYGGAGRAGHLTGDAGATRAQLGAKRGRIEGRLAVRKDTLEAGYGYGAITLWRRAACLALLGVAQALFG